MRACNKSLGQYFTPPSVARFAWRALQMFAPALCQPRTIDPACGAGVFLQAALELQVTAARNLWGCEKDAAIRQLWVANGLADSGINLLIHNGLMDYRPQVVAESFDVVIGNPPFHNRDLDDAPPDLLQQLGTRFRLWTRGKPLPPTFGQLSSPLDSRLVTRLKNFPSELLFLERFCELCKSDGWIVIILPEGVCANQRWRFVRQWLVDNFTIRGVVGLPRGTFRAGRTVAKTCLLLMQKAAPPPGHRVLMAEVEQVGAEDDQLPAVLEAWRQGTEIGTSFPWLPVPGR